jgi:hypothetical protein
MATVLGRYVTDPYKGLMTATLIASHGLAQNPKLPSKFE